MANASFPLPLLLLVTVLCVQSGCHSSGDPALNSRADVFSDLAIMADDLDSQTFALLRTDFPSEEAGGFWYCSYLFDDRFIRRFTLYLGEEGRAQLDGELANWEYNQLTFSIYNESWRLELDELQFMSRLYRSDQFYAHNQIGEELACDWTGPPRDGSVLANDGHQSVEEEGIDVLLVTGNSQNSRDSFWSCRSIANGLEWPIQIFSDGTIQVDNASGRWMLTENNQIEVRVPNHTQQWRDVSILAGLDVRYSVFTAKFDNDDVECVWSGMPRASEYVVSQALTSKLLSP